MEHQTHFWEANDSDGKTEKRVVWSPRYTIISVVDALNYSSIVNGMVFLSCLSWFSIIIILNTVSLFIFLLGSQKLLNCMLIYRTFRRKVKYKSQNDGKSLRIRWVSPLFQGPQIDVASPCSTLKDSRFQPISFICTLQEYRPCIGPNQGQFLLLIFPFCGFCMLVHFL